MTTAEKETASEKKVNGLTLTPLAFTLDQIRQIVGEYSQRLSTVVNIAEESALTQNKKLAILEGTLILYCERETKFVDEQFLAIGLIAGLDRNRLANTECFNQDGLAVYLEIQDRVQKSGIDLTSVDNGYTVELDKLSTDDQTKLYQIIHEGLKDSVENGSTQTILWLNHKDYRPQSAKRSLKTHQIEISKGESDEIKAELEPGKRYHIVMADAPFIITPIKGSEYESLMNMEKEVKKQGKSLPPKEADRYRTYRTMVAGLRRVLRAELHQRIVGTELAVTENTDPTAQSIILKLMDNQELFVDKVSTARLDQSLNLLHQDLVVTGGFSRFIKYMGDNILDPEEMKRILSYHPDRASQVVTDMALQCQYYQNIILPEFPWGEKKEVVKRNNDRVESKQSKVGERKVGVAQRIELAPSILPSSVLGVAHLSGLVEQGKVMTLQQRTAINPKDLVIYGTTDFANPVEAIMLANTAISPEQTNGAIYITDSFSHSIGSYLRRILLPTIGSIYNLPDEELQRLIFAATAFNETFEVDIKSIVEPLNSGAVDNYLSQLRALVNEESHFARLYNKLNDLLCKNLGVRHLLAEDFFGGFNFKVGDLSIIGKEVEKAANLSYQRLIDKLINVGLNQQNIDNFLKDLYGEGGAWSLSSRRFIRKNYGDESEVELDYVDPNLPIANLSKYGLTLGGNAWILLTQLMEDRLDQGIVIAHKNTLLGGNYTAPLEIAKNTKSVVSPIIRVIPNGHHALTGDGVDLGFYLLNPSFSNTVKDAFNLTDDPDLIGGKRKIVLEVTNTPIWISGNREYVTTINHYYEPTTGSKELVRNRFGVSYL